MHSWNVDGSEQPLNRSALAQPTGKPIRMGAQVFTELLHIKRIINMYQKNGDSRQRQLFAQDAAPF